MENAYQVVRDFEKTVAHWAGAKYGVAVSSCCNAIFLCLKYLDKGYKIILPSRTYPGVAMAALNAGYSIEFSDMNWGGRYMLFPLNVVDSALSLEKNMYTSGTFYCLSFHYKKHLPIGRGGMILTDDKKAVEWLKMARFDGRREMPLSKQKDITVCGYNMYLEPSQAARGLALFETIKNKNLPDLKVSEQNYPDLRKFSVFK